MPKLLLLILMTLTALPSFAVKRVSVDQLEQMLSASKGKSDATVAHRLSDLELTERLSAARLSRWQAELPGPASRLSLLLLADMSGFHDLPAADMPAIARPDVAAQQKIISLAADYARRTISKLPDFFATRDTLRFEDTPGDLEATPIILPAPLHPVNRSNEKVLYRNGREEVDSGVAVQKEAQEITQGLTTAGVFGPILGTVLVDSAHGKLIWSHWEQGPAGPEAIFSYAVPKSASHYVVGLRGVSSEPLGYHGLIAVDPVNGTILRLVLQADLKPGGPIARSGVFVEYGAVAIGETTYICPVKSVSIWQAANLPGSAYFHFGAVVENNQSGRTQLQTFLNDVVFEEYHVFHVDARMVAAGSSPPALGPNVKFADTTVGLGTETAEHPVEVTPTQSAPSTVSPPVFTESPLVSDLAAPVMPSPKPVDVANLPAIAPAAPKAANSPTPVFHVTPGIVYLDVVVRDRNNHVVDGLTQDDFRIFEDGHRQAIDSFRAVTQTATTAPSDMSRTVTSSGQGTAASPETINLILFDLLDTSPVDQTYARTQMLKFLQSLPPGQRIGLFVLTSGALRMVQDFTGDSVLLTAAARKLLSESSLLFQSRDAELHSNDVTGSLQGLATPNGADTSMIQDIAQSLASENFQHGQVRNEFVTRAFHALAKATDGFNGRKNLFWLAGSFPLSVSSEVLAASRIAVYPISVLGMQANSIDAEMNGNGVTAGPADALGGGRLGAQVSRQDADREDLGRDAEQIAAQTGGEAFVNVNDLAGALRRSLEGGENYYSLVYSPTDKNWNGKFRKIHVELARRGYSLSYRQGYFALASSPTNSTSKSSP